jgi:hypothetical protein
MEALINIKEIGWQIEALNLNDPAQAARAARLVMKAQALMDGTAEDVRVACRADLTGLDANVRVTRRGCVEITLRRGMRRVTDRTVENITQTLRQMGIPKNQFEVRLP